MHGQGTLISPSGEITATGEYCDGRLEKLQSVTITKGDKRHFFEYKDGKTQEFQVDKNTVYKFKNKDLWDQIQNNNLINPYSGRVFNPQFIK